MNADSETLLGFLQASISQQDPVVGADPEVVALALHSKRDSLLHVLDYKRPSPESARQVESLSVTTPKYGEQRLDAEPDRRLALLLSRELQLDEVLCVEYLIAALEERGSFTADTAAGLYLEERQSTVKCLMLLLQDVLQQDLSPQDPPKHPYTLVFRDFVVGLLAEQAPAGTTPGQQGPQVLLTRIIDALKDHSLEPNASSTIHQVLDEAGVPVSRAHLLQLEKRLLCKCLLYALLLQQHVAPQVVASMLELLGGANARLKAAGGSDVFLEEQVHLLLLSLSLAMSMPQEGGTQEEANLGAIAANPTVKDKLAALGLAPPNAVVAPAVTTPPTEGLPAVLRLCWGTLLASANPAQHRQEASRVLVEAQAAGVFRTLRKVFDNPNLKIDDEAHQEAVATCVYRMLGQALVADRALRSAEQSRLDGPLSKAMAERCMKVVKRTGGGGVAFAPLAADDAAMNADHNGTVLGLLSAVFAAHPRLWLAADTHDMLRGPIENLIARTVTHDVMKVSPEVRVPFLEMMSSLAVGEYGTSLVLRQFAEMARSPSLEVLTWRKLFTAIVEYCVRYNTVLAEIARAGLSTGSLSVPVREERLMNTHEANILIAFLALFRQVIEQGTAAEVRAFLEGLERELSPVLSGFPLTEPMFQLMCHPVPNTVKASLDEVLSSMAHRFKDTSGVHLLERLVQCAAVTPGGPMLPGMPRLDLVTQLNEIEARNEEYPETIAFMRLLNSLIAASMLRGGTLSRVGGTLVSGSGPADGGLELGHFTGFVVQHVLAHLWMRGYRNPSQKWEVASVGFQHLELMLELAGRSTMPATEPSQKQPPGWAVIHDVLGNGPIMQALLHTLAPGHEDMSAFKANGTEALAMREAAVVAALRVFNSVLRLDGRFLADTARVMGMDRYQPLHAHLRAGALGVAGVPGGMLGGSGPGGLQRRLLATLLEYVCYQDNEDVQVEAIKLTLELSLRLPNLVELLQQPGSTAGTAEASSPLALRRGYAIALRQSIFKAAAADNLDDPMQLAGADTADVRPALILRLLLQNASLGSAPSLTHLLMGYDVEPSMSGLEESLLLPRVEYSCLTIFERALLYQGCFLARSKPKLYSQMLNVIYLLATTPISSVPILEYLSPKNNPLLVNLKEVLGQPLPDTEQTYECAASLHQLSWIMRLQALLLLRLEHVESMRTVLSELLKLPGEDAEEEGGGMVLTPVGRYTLLEMLHVFSTLKLQEPYLADIPAEERRLQAEMSVNDVSVEALIAHPHVQTALGIHMRSDTGDVLFDVAALFPLLVQRYEQYVARGGQAGPAAAEAPAAAIRGVLRYVQHFNAYALLSGAQAAVAEAWLQLTQIVFTRQYEQLAAVLPHGPAERLLEVLMASLEVTRRLLTTVPGTNSDLSPLMVNVARILLSKLQEQAVVNVSMGQSADPLALVRAPHRCHELLRLLLELLALSRRVQPVRVQLYAALLQYLQFCRGSKLSSACSPLVLEAVLQGLGTAQAESRTAASAAAHSSTLALTNGYTDSTARQLVLQGGAGNKGPGAAAAAAAAATVTSTVVARLDAAQEAIEQGNALLVNEQGPVLVDIMARDALDSSAPQLQQAVALHALSALVAAGAASPSALPTTTPAAGLVAGSSTSGSLAGALYAHNVPQALLAGLAGVPQALLAAHARGSRRAVFVIEAQLGLLLQLGQSGPSPRVRQLAAQSLSALQPLQHLAGCRALDVEPEDPGSVPGPVGSGQMDTLRFRLQHLMAPTLRLVLAIVAPLPESNAVRHDARLFVGAHYRALDRVLREAASPGNFNWTPGDSELEQAELVTSLLSRLVPVWAELGPTQAEGLRHALFRLALAFCCLDTKSTSPIVKSLHTLSPHPGQASPNRTALVSRALRVASLRAVLARFLRDLVAHHQHHPIQGGATSGASLGDGHGGAGAPLRCLGPGPRPEYDPHTARPTLMLVRDMAEQATVDAGAALDELEGLLGLLRMPDRALDDATCAEKLVEYGPPGGAAAVAAAEDSAGLEGVSGAGGLGGLLARRRLARHYLALAASQLDTLLGKDLFILEHSLAIIVLHFVRYLPRPLASAPGAASAAAGGGGMAQGAFQPSLGGSEEMLMDAAAASLSATGGGQQQGEVGAGPQAADAAALGSSADLAYFVSRLQETCLHAEELLGKVSDLAGGGPEQLAATPAATSGPGPTGSRHMLRLEGIDLMVRTLKSYCASF